MTLPRPARQGETTSIDTEFFGQRKGRLHRPEGTFACLSIAYSPTEVYQVFDASDLRAAIERISPGLWVGHNLMYDIRQLRRFVDIPQRPVFDTMMMDQDLWGGYYRDFGLADASRRWLGKRLEKEARDLFGKATIMTPEMIEYAATDAVRTLEVMQAQRAYIAENEMEMRHYWEVDEPAMWAFLDFEPVKIDVDGWLKLAQENEQEAARLEKELGFNTMSPKQVIDAVKKQTGRTIKDTNAKDTLEPLADELRRQKRDRQAEFVDALLDVRRLRKMSSTYGRTWVDKYVEAGGLVYADWHVTAAETGRSSCSSPGLQQIPTRRVTHFRK